MSAPKNSTQNSKKISTKEQELKTEAPISEKDEVKAAERRQNKTDNKGPSPEKK